MTYYLWGLPERPISTVIAVDMRGGSLRELFEESSVAAEVELENVNPWERQFVVAAVSQTQGRPSYPLGRSASLVALVCAQVPECRAVGKR